MELFGNWSYPTQILFGNGRVKELSDLLKSNGLKRPLFVTDKGLMSQNITKVTLNHIVKNGFEYSLFSNVDPNPNELNLKDGLQVFREGNYDSVIAFGGGSALDLGKMIAFMCGQVREIWDFEDIGDWWKRAIVEKIVPIIAIPTTAGTGSEVGRASVITNSITHEKKIIYHPKVLPSAVILDPELTVGMPNNITSGTGMDALAHCVEAFCSPHYHPMGQGIALEGMRLVKENLLLAFNNPNNLTARAHMMSAAMMGATAFQKGLGAIHAISHPIGALYNTHHGTTNAVIMKDILDFNRNEIEVQIANAANYLGIDHGFDGFKNFVIELNQSLGIPKNLSEIGVSNPDIDRITDIAMRDPSVSGNPRIMTKENTKKLVETLF
ncbi:MAG: iron-containing alcohol dehydrogenase [Paracoccaceae bacterium]|jgi:alcohol dehydrogenase class IV|nr:iron-containing alcohol dehydrogenase [Paracoccaceae bacterium]MDG1880042.1 iron-containing alcohol dehydrogenase [Paracoccaceae bacterium]MDG1940220.1 iron-containing alcohol dehydrogenase [Paracoccaceae bacterium]|tara:strand:- start:1928 stop:3073 length:1146 start_codon:yes stop_codon:yes gene_type:complete